MYKLGYRPSHPDAVKLHASDYVDVKGILPTIPTNFGHYSQVADWGMLGNDQYGDCVFAGGAHRVMLWNAANGRKVPFSTGAVLADYAYVTGFDPSDPSTDQGADPASAAQYEKTVGIRDAGDNRHKIGAYLKLQARNWDELVAATYLFGCVGMAITVTDVAQKQFASKHPWTAVDNGTILGGHYVPVVGRSNGLMQAITWGGVQPFDQGFFMQNNVELLAYVSKEYLTAGKSPEGLNQAALVRDLKTVSTIK